jgi:hypothetical protein
MWAFVVSDQETGDVKHDKAYVEWMVTSWGDLDAGNGSQILARAGVHSCTEEDFKKFYTPNLATKKPFEKMKKDLVCLDDIDNNGKAIDKLIYG